MTLIKTVLLVIVPANRPTTFIILLRALKTTILRRQPSLFLDVLIKILSSNNDNSTKSCKLIEQVVFYTKATVVGYNF